MAKVNVQELDVSLVKAEVLTSLIPDLDDLDEQIDSLNRQIESSSVPFSLITTTAEVQRLVVSSVGTRTVIFDPVR